MFVVNDDYIKCKNKCISGSFNKIIKIKLSKLVCDLFFLW